MSEYVTNHSDAAKTLNPNYGQPREVFQYDAYPESEFATEPEALYSEDERFNYGTDERLRRVEALLRDIHEKVTVIRKVVL